jgi:hypothetical protein
VRFLWAKNMDAAKDIHKEMLPIWAAFLCGPYLWILKSGNNDFCYRIQTRSEIQGDKKKGTLKCVVAAMYSWQHCETGTLSYRQPRHSVIMDQWNGQQRAFTIKMFYKNNDSLEGAQKEFKKFPFFVSPVHPASYTTDKWRCIKTTLLNSCQGHEYVDLYIYAFIMSSSCSALFSTGTQKSERHKLKTWNSQVCPKQSAQSCPFTETGYWKCSLLLVPTVHKHEYHRDID